VRRRWLLACAGLLALGCLDGPTPGEVTLALQSPNQDDGAISFVIKAAAPNEVTGVTAICEGCDAFVARVSATELRAILTGNLTAGPVARVTVMDGSPNQVYSAELIDVSSRTFAPRDVSRYGLSVQP
jgi:hypothetical protein